ncbi:hypothetical protein BLA6993_01673 [Burkholderia lata]|nr:hypothetical protein BLA6993_01673 [Burkholderia lata]
MSGEPLFHERLRIVVSNGSEWGRQRRKVALADLVDTPWNLSPNEVLPHSPVVDAFRAIGTEPADARVLTGSLNLRRTLLRTGGFVTVMPHSLLHYGPDREWIKVLPIDLPAWTVPTMLITLRNRTLSTVAERFAEYARKLARSLGDT